MKNGLKTLIKSNILFIACLLALTVDAHTVNPDITIPSYFPSLLSADGFITGFIHPWLGMEHLLVAIAICAWSSLLRSHVNHWLPMIFILGMGCGLLLSMVAVRWSVTEIVIIACIILAALLVNHKLKRPLVIAFTSIAFFGLLHGNIHGAALMVSDTSLLAGLLVSTSLMLLFTWMLTNSILNFVIKLKVTSV